MNERLSDRTFNAKNRLQLSKSYFGKEQYEEALQIIQPALAAVESLPDQRLREDVFLLMADCHLHLKNFSEARWLSEHLLQQEPKWEVNEIQEILAEACFQLGDSARAAELFREVARHWKWQADQWY